MSDRKKEFEKDLKEPRPFGVDYVHPTRRFQAKAGEWNFVGKTDEIPVGKAKAIDGDKFKIAIFNLEGTFYAIKDACPHAQYPLNRGTLRGDIVSCSSHNWQFSVRTGQCIRAEHDMDCSNIVIRTFSVEIRNENEIWIKM